jgi:hypothetical protein
VRRVATLPEVGFQSRAAGVDHHVTADDDRVARKPRRFFGRDGNQSRDVLGKRPLRIFVESGRKIERLGLAQRAKARVQVIVILIDQLQADRAAADLCGEPVQGACVASDDVSGKQRVSAKQGIARPLEVPAFRHLQAVKTLRAKPNVVDRGLGLTGRVSKPR